MGFTIYMGLNSFPVRRLVFCKSFRDTSLNAGISQLVGLSLHKNFYCLQKCPDTLVLIDTVVTLIPVIQKFALFRLAYPSGTLSF